MTIEIVATSSQEIASFRNAFLQENNFQFTYDKCHLYGWADAYWLVIDGTKAGYGALWGLNREEKRIAIFEFYLLPPWRKMTTVVFRQFIHATGAKTIECQSNDWLLTSMLYEFAENIRAEAILFEESFQTAYHIPGAVLLKENTEAFKEPDMGGWVVQFNGETVATGGFMLNYNFPYADIYMEVKENFRQQGFGSLIVQELKKEIYRIGRVPAARCNINNLASKLTLLKAGFVPCGFRLKGDIRQTE